MIADLKPYAECEESGLPWLGQVPGHWKVRRLKSHLLRNDSGVWGTTFDERGTVVLRSTEQSIDGGWRLGNPARIRLSNTQKAAALLALGDLVVTKSSGSALHIGKTSLVTQRVAEMECCFSNFMQRLRVSQEVLSPQFAWTLLNSRVGRAQFVYQTTTTTGLGNLNGTILGNCVFSFPPPAEQAAIVRFLDWANGRLELAIRAKRKVITLLNEQKQAIIHRAVTRGLDPSVPLKPSGIPWLGDIPQHWELIPARHLFRSVTRRDIQGDELKMSVTQKHGLVPTAEMQENSTQASSFDRFQLCHPNDLVLNKYKAHLGVFWAATRRGLITPNYTVFRPARRLSTKFFEHLFHTGAYRDAFSMVVYGVIEGMCPLYTQDFYRIPCACPSHDEQARIVDALVNMTKGEDTAISRLEREVELLREYRTRLVADAVTGKLDVREAAARLPDEAPLEAVEDDTDLGNEAEAADEEAAV